MDRPPCKGKVFCGLVLDPKHIFKRTIFIIVGYVGDSRAYLFSNGKLKQLTVDHSYVQQLVDSGEISNEEAKKHPRRNEITKAIGISENLDCDFVNCNVKEKDLILLCSDGLTGSCDEEDIAKILSVNLDVKNSADMLVDLANAYGGQDNVTVVLLKI